MRHVYSVQCIDQNMDMHVWLHMHKSTMIINIALTGSCCWLMYNLLTLTCDKRLDFHKTSRVLCIKDNMYYSLWGYTRYTCSYLRLIIVLLEVGTVTSRGTIHYPEIRLVKIHVFPCCVFMWTYWSSATSSYNCSKRLVRPLNKW